MQRNKKTNFRKYYFSLNINEMASRTTNLKMAHYYFVCYFNQGYCTCMCVYLKQIKFTFFIVSEINEVGDASSSCLKRVANLENSQEIQKGKIKSPTGKEINFLLFDSFYADNIKSHLSRKIRYS